MMMGVLLHAISRRVSPSCGGEPVGSPSLKLPLLSTTGRVACDWTGGVAHGAELELSDHTARPDRTVNSFSARPFSPLLQQTFKRAKCNGFLTRCLLKCSES